MLPVLNYLTEEVVTRRDVGGGFGGYLGRSLGSLGGAALGGALGYFSGQEEDGTPSNDQQARMLLGAGLGGTIGRIGGGQLGRYIGKRVISDPDAAADFSKASHRIGHLANPVTTGYGVASDVLFGPRGARVATNFYNALSKDGAAKLGYKTPGKIGTFLFGPLSGLFRPGQIGVNR